MENIKKSIKVKSIICVISLLMAFIITAVADTYFNDIGARSSNFLGIMAIALIPIVILVICIFAINKNIKSWVDLTLNKSDEIKTQERAKLKKSKKIICLLIIPFMAFAIFLIIQTRLSYTAIIIFVMLIISLPFIASINKQQLRLWFVPKLEEQKGQSLFGAIFGTAIKELQEHKCEYCGGIIKRGQTKCDGCGAKRKG